MLRNLSSARLPLTGLRPSSFVPQTGLAPSQLIDFCILLGNDACPRIRGVGPVSSAKLIREHGTIEAILANDPKVRAKVPDVEGYMELVRTARGVFGDLPEVTEEVKRELEETFERMKKDKVNVEEVEKWLEERHGVRFVDADEVIDSETGIYLR